VDDDKSFGSLASFLSFPFTYKACKVHNMLTLMLNPCFKYLDVVKPFIGRAKVIYMVDHGEV
jgi:hypothetical protein